MSQEKRELSLKAKLPEGLTKAGLQKNPPKCGTLGFKSFALGNRAAL
jgi:hypothetical protein